MGSTQGMSAVVIAGHLWVTKAGDTPGEGSALGRVPCPCWTECANMQTLSRVQGLRCSALECPPGMAGWGETPGRRSSWAGSSQVPEMTARPPPPSLSS